MATLVFTFIFFALIMSAMAIGVIIKNKPIAGSCGGLAAVGLDGDCEICGGDRNKCEEETKKAKTAYNPALVKDAMEK